MKALKALLLCFTPAFLLAGCWDKSELEEQAYVVVLGLDLTQNNLIDVTFQIANPQVGSSDRGEAKNEPASDTVTFTAPDILSAKELANTVVSRKLNFGHLRTIIVGEKLARSPLFHQYIGSSLRDPEMRRETNIIVSKEKASEFLHKNKPKLETRPHKYYAFMQERWRDTGLVPYSTLNRYFQRLSGEIYLAIYATTQKTPNPKADEDAYRPGEVPQEAGDPVQEVGSAVFRNGKMISTMNGEDTRYTLFLRRRALAHSFIASYPDPLKSNYRISLRLLKKGNTKINVNVKKDPMEIKVTVPVKAQIHSVPSLIDYASDLDKQKLLKQAIVKRLETDTMKLVKRTQREFKGEPFVWYVEARRKFWTLQEYEQYNWEKKYTTAVITVHYDLDIESFGKALKPSRMKK